MQKVTQNGFKPAGSSFLTLTRPFGREKQSFRLKSEEKNKKKIFGKKASLSKLWPKQGPQVKN